MRIGLPEAVIAAAELWQRHTSIVAKILDWHDRLGVTDELHA